MEERAGEEEILDPVSVQSCPHVMYSSVSFVVEGSETGDPVSAGKDIGSHASSELSPYDILFMLTSLQMRGTRSRMKKRSHES